ncbi:MAG: uroporphyrinogen decarboxylase, partial [Acetobacterium sp.]|nr:uroporphyrinogen decarboxylase [Acetobacterium sp.]
LKASIPNEITPYSMTTYMLHMPTFMREKDFEKLWWPQWLQQCNDLASMGVRVEAFCEDDWMRYLDYLLDLPAGTRLQFEYGDAKVIKEKLGKRHIISGLFPVAALKSCSKDEIIYKTREFLDIMMPGGNFEFKFDKDPLLLSDLKIENLTALCETINKYGVYDNAGETAGIGFNKVDYKLSDAPVFTSKYYRSWEQYKAIHPYTPESAKEIVMGLEDRMLKEVYFFCM